MIYFVTQQNHKFVKIGYTTDIDKLPQPETLDNGRMTYQQVSDYIKDNSLWDD